MIGGDGPDMTCTCVSVCNVDLQEVAKAGDRQDDQGMMI